MLRIVKLKETGNGEHNLLLQDVDNGYSVRDILEFPDVYSNFMEKNPGVKLHLVQLEGNIGTYRTTCYALELEGDYDPDDVTELMSQLLTIPETAVKAMISNFPEEMQEAARDAVATVKYCEELPGDVKFCLPVEVFDRLPEEETRDLLSSRSSYVLKSTDNQEIFQKSYDANFGVLLPELEAIHGNTGELVNALDVLRVLAPYRYQSGKDSFSYYAIYHTPYYKVDARLKGMVMSQFSSWINGYSSNDTLDIQANEQHMVSNIKTLICADISRYIREMVSGIFFDTPLGSLLGRLCTQRDAEVIQQLYTDIKERSTDEVSCEIPFSEIDELQKNGWFHSDVVRTIKKSLVMSDTFLNGIIVNRPVDRRIVECDNLPFTLELADVQEQDFAETMISMGYISGAMERFLVDLCKKAYRVNWGHTGATKSIPRFEDRGAMDELSKIIGEFVTSCNSDELPDVAQFPQLYRIALPSDDDDEAMFMSDDATGRDEIVSTFEYYVTVETAQRIEAGTLPEDYFSTTASAAQTTEASIVEYWRNVNGENNLESFISMTFLKTADTSIFGECFIKLMRWGERKPKALVLQKHPEIRNLFDLGAGLVTDNTAIVDEESLVLHNGCEYTFAGPIVSTSNTDAGLKSDMIIGFGLTKDYGVVKRLYLASWLDLGEMIASDKINIAEFLAINPVNITADNFKAIEPISKEKYEIYISDSRIDESFKLKVQAKELSAMTLFLQPGILQSVEYIRSLKNDTVISTRDRQYDLLRRYVRTLNEFYAQHEQELQAVTNSIELRECISVFYTMFKNDNSAKADVNTARANSAIQSLNLEGVGSKPTRWDDSPLEGKFRLVYDIEMIAPVAPMQFTSMQMKNVSAQLRNRVVMLLLQLDKKFVLCRKDIEVNDILVVNGKNGDGSVKKTFARHPYSTFGAAIEALQRGESRSIQGIPLFLHTSLKDFL